MFAFDAFIKRLSSERKNVGPCKAKDFKTALEALKRNWQEGNADNIRQSADKLMELLVKVPPELNTGFQKVSKATTNNQKIETTPTPASASESEEILSRGNNKLPVADLSDANRPSQLANRYSKLYANKWSNAFRVLSETKVGEETRIIKELFQILKDAFNYCKDVSAKQLTIIENAVMYPTKQPEGPEEAYGGLSGFGVNDVWRATHKEYIIEMVGKCFMCDCSCSIECGKCGVVLGYMGQKHKCQDFDEGLYDENDVDTILCADCEFVRQILERWHFFHEPCFRVDRKC